MTHIQITLIQIDNYGPWTVTPEPRREVDLQTLQSRLYADLSQLFGSRGGYVFYGRFDNMFAVTNGVGVDHHELVQETINNRYPVSVSLSFASGPTPITALSKATEALQCSGSAQDNARQQVLHGQQSEEIGEVTIVHFDVDDATGEYTDRLNAFDSMVRIKEGYMALTHHLRETHEALAFFVGGDNIIAACPVLDATDYRKSIAHVENVADVTLKAGVGRGMTAHEAGMEAKYALERCRETGKSIIIPE